MTGTTSHGTAQPRHANNPKRSTIVRIEIPALLLDFISGIAKTFVPYERALDEILLETENWRRACEPPSIIAFDNARTMLNRLKMRDIRPHRVLASAEGGIGFFFRRAGRYADFEFQNDGSITAVVSDGAGYVDAFSVHVSFEGQLDAIDRIGAFLKN